MIYVNSYVITSIYYQFPFPAYEFYIKFITCNAELSAESVAKLQSEVNRRLFELINSSAAHEKLGAIVAIGE